jgi:tRNA-(ms[2]io[6]A)-hydroxylase
MRNPRSPQDPVWLARAVEDTDALLEDHAHCERKAAATAMALVARHPELPDLVAAMVELAREELEHFEEVHRRIVSRGRVLGQDPGDPYAQALVGQVRGTPAERLIDRLLVSALIEARSCERLRLLGMGHPDEELREMWMRFARSEANHGELFLKLARQYGGARERVDARLAELAEFEARWVDESPVRCAIH